jgi:hypothetical protein
MKNYHYHPELKYFIGESFAMESPREPGVYLLPAHATKVQPPECGLREIQIFNGESWDIIEDKRGTYYSTERPEVIDSFYKFETIDIIGNDNPLKAPENATKEKPPEVPEGHYLTWNDGWVLEEIPPPKVLTPQEKLESLGLTIEDLKDLLGISN